MFQKMLSNCDCLWGVNKKDIALSLVRVAVAIVFIYHGWMKVSGMEQTLGMFGSMGIPTILTYFVAYVEFLGGIALLLGMFVEIIASVFAVIMVFAIYLVHWKNGFNVMNGGYEFQLVLLLASIALAVAGSKCFILDKIMGKGSNSCVCK